VDESQQSSAPSKPWQIPGFARFRQLAFFALANVLVIYSTLFFGWSLAEVLAVYTGEWLLLVLVAYARVLAARRLPPDLAGASNSPWKLAFYKAMAILVTFPMYALFIGFFALVAAKANAVPQTSTWVMALCLATFATGHVIQFVQQFAHGAFDELLSDRIVLMPFWRFPVLIVVLVVSLLMQSPRFGHGPAALVIVVALIAILDTALQRIDTDYVEARIARRDGYTS